MKAPDEVRGNGWAYSVVVHIEIDTPASKIWPYFIGDKKGKWAGLDDEPVEYITISGRTGEVGEVYSHKLLFHGYQLFYTAIAVKPYEQIVLKITHKKTDSDAELLS